MDPTAPSFSPKAVRRFLRCWSESGTLVVHLDCARNPCLKICDVLYTLTVLMVAE